MSNRSKIPDKPPNVDQLTLDEVFTIIMSLGTKLGEDRAGRPLTNEELYGEVKEAVENLKDV